MAAENTREIVLDMLLAVERKEAFSHHIARDVLTKYDYLSGQEKAFIKRLFEGTLERRIEMDYFLNQVSSLPAAKMKPLIRNLLRMGSYQILYMDSVPDAAAVSEAVKLAGKRKFHNLKGFVNGVLRKLAADKEQLKLPSEENEPEMYLSVAFSMPLWLVRHFLSLYSYEKTKQIASGLLEARPVTIRFRQSLAEGQKEALIAGFREKGITVGRHPYVEEAYCLTNCENPAALPGYGEGSFVMQDASSMLAVMAAGIKPGDFVLDMCAAPGGKTLLAAEYAGEKGRVWARDISEQKVSLIEENVKRMGLTNVEIKVWDATKPDPAMQDGADVVIADVPCSGLGVIGRKNDIKYRQTPEAVKEIAALQKEIVRQACASVKPGGVLLYSTCTINPVENEDMADWICREFGYTLDSLTAFLPNMPETKTAEKGYLQLLPGVHDTDGFFFARLVKGKNG